LVENQFFLLLPHNLRRMSIYVHRKRSWPEYTWDERILMGPLSSIRHRQGRLLGRMEGLSLPLREEAFVGTLTIEVVASAALDGESLNTEQVRCSVQRQLGIGVSKAVPAGFDVEGMTGMVLEAIGTHGESLTERRLTDWHRGLFAPARKRMSGMVHYQTPNAGASAGKLKPFLDWFNGDDAPDPVIKSAIAHLWFMSVQPFDGGNGRIARAITDRQLARAEGTAYRFYSMSDRIRNERVAYHDVLLAAQRGDGNITAWLSWFLRCLGDAVAAADEQLVSVLRRAEFWGRHGDRGFNERQKAMLGRMLDGVEGKMTSSKWAQLTGTSADTAVRDINELVGIGVMKKEAAGGRSTSYVLA
jgi:Fic family protein